MGIRPEQEKAINHEDGDLIVSASAGSGKTFVMISRIIRLISLGKARADEILAVTFTDAAAAEMKVRLTKALIDKINGGRDDLKEQLSLIPVADVTTLHAFAGRLIRKYFYSVGVTPDYEIMDEVKSGGLKERAVTECFKELYDSKDPSFLRMVDRYASSRADKSLRRIIIELYTKSVVEEEPSKWLYAWKDFYSAEGNEKAITSIKLKADKNLKKIIVNLQHCISIFEREGVQKCLALCKKMFADSQYLVGSQDVYAFKTVETNYDMRSLEKSASLSEEARLCREMMKEPRNVLVGIVENVKKYLTTAEEDKIKTENLAEQSRELTELVEKFSAKYEVLKREENALDFDDLGHLALKILKDEKIGEEVRKKYKYVFVDEYQDVNGLQEAFLTAVSNNNLFCVGDVKQSIYGFRGCNPRYFIEKTEKMEKQNAMLKLNANFRSCKNVINFVNEIFNFAMTKESCGLDYKKDSELEYGGGFDSNDGRAQLHLILKEKKEKKELPPRIYDILEETEVDEDDEKEASLVAQIILEELKEKHFDPKDKVLKDITFGDIAILLRGLKGQKASKLVRGLVRRGIPVISGVKTNLTDYNEIKVLIKAMELICSFNSDVPLATVLKSDIGGFSDRELYTIAEYGKQNGAGSFYNAYCKYLYESNEKDDALKEKLSVFDEKMKKIRFLADFLPAKDILTRLVRESGLDAGFLSSKLGEAKLRRIERFISISGTQNYSVKDFLYLAKNSENSFEITETCGENAVYINTVHSAKGLEYPVVILYALEKSFNKRDESGKVIEDETTFAAKYFNDEKRTTEETLFRGIVKEKLAEKMVMEEARIFYVACTRAQYSLHLIYTAESDDRKSNFEGANSFKDFLPDTLPIITHTNNEYIAFEKNFDQKRILAIVNDKEATEKLKQTMEKVYPFEADTTLPLKTSVTAAVHNIEETIEETGEILYSFDLEEETSAELGTIAHKFMENFDFSYSNDVFKEAQRQIEAGLIEKTELDKINLERLANTLKCGVFSSLKDKKLYREKSFLFNCDANILFGYSASSPVLVQGVIDLLAIDDSGAHIIDYKYSVKNGEQLRAKYAKQLDIYANAVEEILNIKVLSKTLVSLLSGEIVEIV